MPPDEHARRDHARALVAHATAHIENAHEQSAKAMRWPIAAATFQEHSERAVSELEAARDLLQAAAEMTRPTFS